MKKRTAILLSAGISLASIASTYGVMNYRYVLVEKDAYSQPLVKLVGVYQLVRTKYLDPVKDKELTDGAIEGMLASTKDIHSSYFPANDDHKISQTLGENYQGIGIEVMMEGDLLTVTNVFKNGPAKQAGLLANDQIIKVNNQNVIGMDMEKVIEKVKGKKGTSVTLTVVRASIEKPFDLTVKRDEIPIETVHTDTYTVKGKRLGKIEISSFSEQTATEFKQALKNLEKTPLDGLILDVRGNGGGYLQAVQGIANELLPKGKVIIDMQNKNKQDQRTYSTSNNQKDYPIVVLIDQGSASASEVLAATLSENQRYPLIGQKSYGKGSVQELIRLNDESELKLTTEKWLTPKGNWIHKKGLKPDINVKQPAFFYQPFIHVKKAYVYDQVNENILYTQRLLKILGNKDIRTDGYFDKNTEKALTDYQTKKGIKETGNLDKETATHLNKDFLALVQDEAQDAQLQAAIQQLTK